MKLLRCQNCAYHKQPKDDVQDEPENICASAGICWLKGLFIFVLLVGTKAIAHFGRCYDAPDRWENCTGFNSLQTNRLQWSKHSVITDSVNVFRKLTQIKNNDKFRQEFAKKIVRLVYPVFGGRKIATITWDEH